MIRTACAWLLVVLAISPVTAPFSTCDLLALCTHASYTLSVPDIQAQSTVALAGTPDGDAYSVSPLVTRTPPDHGASRVTPGVPAASASVRAGRAGRSYAPLRRKACGVLRV